MSADFLLELLSEEIPARMQDKARDDLARLFAAEIEKAGLRADGIATFATPRRLGLVARGLPATTAPVSEEVKGPRSSAPPQALEGFLRKSGLAREQLVERDGIFFAVIERPGRATADVLAEAVPAIVRAFPWPKSMRWGEASASNASLRWVRPLQGIVALLGEDVVPFAIEGVASGRTTAGHRFHHPAPVTIGDAGEYPERLRAAHVIVDPAERRRIVADGATAAAAANGLALVPDAALVAENAGLTEWPVPLVGGFDPAFLEVPREVIQLTMRTNQRYFACVDAAGALAPAFVCTANIDAPDGGTAIVAGNRKVLAARLADARFFWEQDLAVPLADRAATLGQIVFHEKLGSLAQKVERVARLARWLVEQGVVGEGAAAGGTAELADHAERAARLAKADLVTGMVGEFPELQGIMGGYYAAHQGEPSAVADAVRDHYKPAGQGDAVPTAPATVAVSLADKLDTIAGFFMVNLKPTGSKDPFALRRAAIGVIALILANRLRGSLPAWLGQARRLLREQGIADERPGLLPPAEADRERQAAEAFTQDVRDFAVERLKVQQREAGVRHDLIDAVFALGGEDDLLRLLARVGALQAFVSGDEGRDLLAGYKRAANILKKERWQEGTAEADAAQSSEPAEAALRAGLDHAEQAAMAAVAQERFEEAMAALAGLRLPIDAFFDQVTVNHPDPAIRSARLDLLGRIRRAVHQVADFSRIEG